MLAFLNLRCGVLLYLAARCWVVMLVMLVKNHPH